jgi:hypothetical protein
MKDGKQRTDTERLDWMGRQCADCGQVSIEDTGHSFVLWWPFTPRSAVVADSLRAAIDAAMDAAPVVPSASPLT